MTEPSWGRARSAPVTWHDPSVTAAAAPATTGLEFLGAIQHGVLPAPPVAALFGLEMLEVEAGRVVFSCRAAETADNPIGTVHGGLGCTLADTVTACAVHSTLEAGVGDTSIDLTVHHLRPVTTAGGAPVATGAVTERGRRVAFSAAEIVEGTGRAVATASSSCLVMGPG